MKRWSIPALAAVLYFAQGFPFGIVDETLNLYLSSTKGIRLSTIGLANSVGYAWSLKLLWAPLIDKFGTYRGWIVGSLLAITACIATFAVAPAASLAFWIAMALLAVASATQDIAIDAMTIRITPANLLGLVNSARVAAYRVAILAAGNGIVEAAERIGWSRAFTAAAIIPLVIIAIVRFTLPAESPTEARQEKPLRALLEWLRRPGSAMLLAVILLYRLGDSALASMIKPYWFSRGFSAGEVARVTISVGMICTIAGAFAGGAFIARFGIFRSLLWLGIAQAGSNIVYALVATTGAGRGSLWTASIVETFTGGLGIAAFLSFLMFICDKANAATEYAALSAVFALSRTFARSMSGFLAEDMGFAPYYWLTAALALPGLLLLPFIRERVRGAPAVIATE